MKVKTLTKSVTILAIIALFSVPSWAGSFGVFGSYWDSKDADASWGAGARVGFNLTKMLELDFRGTYYPDFQSDDFPGLTIDLTAIPVDGGLKINFLPDKFVNPYAGAGISYYFLTIDPGEIDDQTGIYLNGGVEIGDSDSARFFADLMWRKVDTSIKFGAFDEDVRFDGIALNAGVSWRWGS